MLIVAYIDFLTTLQNIQAHTTRIPICIYIYINLRHRAHSVGLPFLEDRAQCGESRSRAAAADVSCVYGNCFRARYTCCSYTHLSSVCLLYCYICLRCFSMCRGVCGWSLWCTFLRAVSGCRHTPDLDIELAWILKRSISVNWNFRTPCAFKETCWALH